MLKVIKPTNEDGTKFTDPAIEIWKNSNVKSIFLAGPCPRVDYNDDWRFEAIKYLEEVGFDGIVFNPTNPKYNANDPTYLEKQTSWEVHAMMNCDLVVFWIPRSEKNPAFTTNIELGQFLWMDKIDNIMIGMPNDSIKNEYIRVRLNMLNKRYDNDLKTLIYHTVEELK